MNFCASNSEQHLGGFSRSHLIRESRKSEKELLDSLTKEINELARESLQFETQYKSLLDYYHRLAREKP